jgi:hypothetical protein
MRSLPTPCHTRAISTFGPNLESRIHADSGDIAARSRQAGHDTRPDLAARALFLTLPAISDARRRSEKELSPPPRRADRCGQPPFASDAFVRVDRLPRMADFALWATACETALWPAGTFACAYEANRKAAVVDSIEADPVAACVRELMTEGRSWTGSAADLLRAGANRSRDDVTVGSPDWPKNPRALAGRLRRAQSFLRALGIAISFSREGRTGSRIIRMHASLEDTVSTVSRVRDDRSPPQPADDVCDNNYCPDLVGPCLRG